MCRMTPSDQTTLVGLWRQDKLEAGNPLEAPAETQVPGKVGWTSEAAVQEPDRADSGLTEAGTEDLLSAQMRVWEEEKEK